MGMKQIDEIQKQSFHLGQAMGLLYWDNDVNIASGAVEERSLTIAALDQMRIKSLKNPEVATWILRAEQEDLSAIDRRELELFKKRFHLAKAVPDSLNAEFTKQSMNTEYQWRKLRFENDWKRIEPLLASVVRLAKEIAKYEAEVIKKSNYEVLMEGFFEEASIQSLDQIFGEVKTFVVQNFHQVRKSHYQVFGGAKEDQVKLNKEILPLIGFHSEKGRLDEATHPFCSSFMGEARLTTRYNENDFLISTSSTIHEVGHGLYELGLPSEHRGRLIGQSSSFLHEGQSLFYEKQIATSPEFAEFVAPLISQTLGHKGFTPENYLAPLLDVKPGFIRVDADEMTYPLHVILRYEIEKELFNGDLRVAEIPEVWDAKMQAYFGISTKGNFKDGCLQDPHWLAGQFGYFPLYLIGAMVAAQQFEALSQQDQEIQSKIKLGNFQDIKGWLTQNIWGQGSLYSPQQILKAATGNTLSAEPFLNYLKKRYLRVDYSA